MIRETGTLPVINATLTDAAIINAMAPVNPAALFTHCGLILLKRGYYADFYITLLGRCRNRR